EVADVARVEAILDAAGPIERRAGIGGARAGCAARDDRDRDGPDLKANEPHCGALHAIAPNVGQCPTAVHRGFGRPPPAARRGGAQVASAPSRRRTASRTATATSG